MPHIAKVFQNGRSQAVRLPAAFRFDTKEVFVRRDPATGDVILSTRPTDWQALLDAADRVGAEGDDFLVGRKDEVAPSRAIF
jgi:antitoxin VapB